MQKLSKILNDNLKAIIIAIPVLIILLPLGYGIVCTVFLKCAESSQPFLEKPDKKYEKCVRETEYMRFKHMDLLKGIRDEVMREGKRGEIELNNCRKCHTSRERFCYKCHNAVNLNLNCFSCHYYPESVPNLDKPEPNR